MAWHKDQMWSAKAHPVISKKIVCHIFVSNFLIAEYFTTKTRALKIFLNYPGSLEKKSSNLETLVITNTRF